jgi:hypothetical protein
MNAGGCVGMALAGGYMPPDFHSGDAGREQSMQRLIELLDEALRCLDELGEERAAAAGKLAEIIALLRSESR